MHKTEATAPGKVILFGEHAVVYGQPAIAAPVSHVRAMAKIETHEEARFTLHTPDINTTVEYEDAPQDHPVAAAIRQIQQAAHIKQLPSLKVTVTSQIPIASGLGSGAAISAAVIRALVQYLDLLHLNNDQAISDLTYEVEKIHHGTPSGIDNTVIAYEQPIYFVRQHPQNKIERFEVKRPLSLLIADTGIRSSTKVAVGDVRRQWQADESKFERLFSACGRIANQARQAIEAGEIAQLGQLMQENHAILQQMTVSSPELDRLVTVALEAGAMGAKLSGAGRGGNMIALVEENSQEGVREALLGAGAKSVLMTQVQVT